MKTYIVDFVSGGELYSTEVQEEALTWFISDINGGGGQIIKIEFVIPQQRIGGNW